ncbi:nucleotide sugar dehydrogenase [Paenibacillus silviterrae]|uniref:nucleotide sugar dehydrogenase n=1 Tax=Paenibacillus silviterrae TaxID=3242194 RepID=UPI002543C027|nr:nucleotide sugar dehydrogenase [Paenibacillus chinjuensis]
MNHNKTVAVIGLGFVGLPLAMTFARKGFRVIGIDTDLNKINHLRNGVNYLTGLDDPELRSMLDTGRFVASNRYDPVEKANSIVICVPTPLNSEDQPDLSYLIQAGEEISRRIKQSQLIVLESSTFPGTTREVLQPILEKSKLLVGKDIFLGYSPERVDPGNEHFSLEQIPKIISGVTDTCANAVYQLYSKVFDQLFMVSSTEAAEFTKLLENTYRFVNISMMNELATICDSLKLNIWEVIEAAKTKPFGYSAFYPGPGVGGHCIPVDPLYLQWKAEQLGVKSSFIELSKKINNQMPEYIVQKIAEHLPNKQLKDANIFIYGAAYKRDINDARESSAIQIMNLLRNAEAAVSYHDPYIPSLQVGGEQLHSQELTDQVLYAADCVLILTDHSTIPIQKIVSSAKFIFDTRNVIKESANHTKIMQLGG